MISKIVMQKTRTKQPEYVVDMIKSRIPLDWKYVNYINGDEELFFKENPLDEFPNIIEIFEKMPTGCHKADLFRFYYLYIYGGVTLDGDAMLYENIEYIVKDYSFFSVIGLDTTTLCNGLMGTSPKNPILREILKYAYNVKPKDFINNYDLFCKNLFKIVNNTFNFKLVLFKEFDYIRGESAKSIDSNGKTVFIHFYKYKIIPKDINKIEQTVIIGPSDISVKLIILEQNYKNSEIILNNHSYDDKFVFEIFNNILIVKRSDASYGWAHNHSAIIREK